MGMICKGKGFYGAFALLCALSLTSCSQGLHYAPYAYAPINETTFTREEKQGYYRQGDYVSFTSSDKGEFPATLESVYSHGFRRHVLTPAGERHLTVIPVDFSDCPASEIKEDYHVALSEAFFGDEAGNQFVSLAQYYDQSSFHRLQVKGEVCPKVFRSSETYAALKVKNNASQTKAALTRIYNEAMAWYNALPERTATLKSGDPIYFVYLAPYSGMDETIASRSSMMWAFTINDPAPICWSSYYMMHAQDSGKVDAHTFIHEFGHMLGLKDYYDPNSYSEISSCSPMGRMDMMDCSLGEHNAFSKMLLGWNRPYVPEGECVVSLRPATGNGDCLLLPVGEYAGNPYDEYLLLEYYSPTYLNNVDASLRSELGIGLMDRAGIRVYHVDARLGLYEDRAKSPVSPFVDGTWIGTRSLDFYRDNSGRVSGGEAANPNGFLLQGLSVHGGTLPSYYVASDHDEDITYGNATVKLRRCLFLEGEGIDSSFKGLTFHKGETPRFGFKVVSLGATEAKIEVKAFQ